MGCRQYRREAPICRLGGDRADGTGQQLRLQQPGGGHPFTPDHAQLRLPGPVRCHPQRATARRRGVTMRVMSATIESTRLLKLSLPVVTKVTSASSMPLNAFVIADSI